MFDWFVLLAPLLLLPVVLLLVFLGCELAHPVRGRFSLTFDTARVQITTVQFEFSLRRPDGSTNAAEIINVRLDDPTQSIVGAFFGGVRGELTRFIGSTNQRCTTIARDRLPNGEWTVRCGYTTADGGRLLPSMGDVRTFTVDRMNAPPPVDFIVEPSRGLSVQLAPPPPAGVPAPTISFSYDSSRADVTQVLFEITVPTSTVPRNVPLRHDNTTSPPPPNPIGTFSGEHVMPLGRSGGPGRYFLRGIRPSGPEWPTGAWVVNVSGSFRDPRGGAEMRIGDSGSVRFNIRSASSAGDVGGALRLDGDRDRNFRIVPGSLPDE